MEHTHTNGEHNHAHGSASKMMDHASALESWLAPIFAQAPHIPAGGRKVISDILPWLSLVFGILGIIGLLSLGGLSMWISPYMMLSGVFHSISLILTLILGLLSSILTFVAFNPLLAKKKKGWNYSFYALIVSAVSTLIHLIFMYSGGLGSIIGIIIGAYLLFEIREMYD